MSIGSFVDVLKSPSVWTGKNGVSKATDLLSNPGLQDKIQLGLMKSSFDTMVKTGDIVIPSAKLKAPTGQLYDAAANAGKNLISPAAGLTSVPKGISSLNLNSLTSGLSGVLAGATGALAGARGLAGTTGGITNSITGSLPSSLTTAATSLANKGSAELGGLLANASKFGVGAATSWAKGSTSTGSISGALSTATSSISGVTGLTSGLSNSLKTQMNSLAKQGQFAVNFSDVKLPAAVAGVVPAPSFKGTVDRSTLNAAFGKLVGSDKIPLPKFSPQAVDDSALTSAANKARSILTNGLTSSGLPSVGSLASLGSSVTSALSTATASRNIASSISNRFIG